MKTEAKIQVVDLIWKQTFPGLLFHSVINPATSWVSKVKEVLLVEKDKESGKDKAFASVLGTYSALGNAWSAPHGFCSAHLG